MREVTLPVPELGDIEGQVACFREHSAVILPRLLSTDEVGALNEAIDRDRRKHPFMWFTTTSRDYNCNLWLTEPIFEGLVRHPRVLALVERLMGGACCFEELAVRHRDGARDPVPTGWHRDRPYWREHPLHLDYPQMIYYLNDVDESTHCFSISPEPADGELLDTEAHLERGGAFHFYGRAGSAILFNCATLHGVTLRRTERVRRTIQVYYGHPHRPPLSEVTLIPPRLWRDHPDGEVRRFYGKLNHFTRLMHAALDVPLGAEGV
jgi:hypothetical protein